MTRAVRHVRTGDGWFALARKLRILFSASCAVLAVALAVMWIRSYVARDEVSWSSTVDEARRSGWTARSIMFGRGQLRIGYRSRLETGEWVSRFREGAGFRLESTVPYPAYDYIDGPPPDFEGLGFVFDYDHDVGANVIGDGENRFLGLLIVTPIWAPMLLCAAVSSVPVVRAIRRRRRITRGLCVRCGYDLRASPECCPECGTSAVREQTSVDAGAGSMGEADGTSDGGRR